MSKKYRPRIIAGGQNFLRWGAESKKYENRKSARGPRGGGLRAAGCAVADTAVVSIIIIIFIIIFIIISIGSIIIIIITIICGGYRRGGGMRAAWRRCMHVCVRA